MFKLKNMCRTYYLHMCWRRLVNLIGLHLMGITAAGTIIAKSETIVHDHENIAYSAPNTL
jgi:hypothetical protein